MPFVSFSFPLSPFPFRFPLFFTLFVSFVSSSDSTGGRVDAGNEDGPWGETDPMFYEMYDAMDF